jgi:hypothetical protein
MNNFSLVETVPQIPFARASLLLVMAVGTILLCLHGAKSIGMSESGVIMQLPQMLQAMPGKPVDISPSEKAILPGDTEMVKMLYQGSVVDNVSVQIVLAGGEKRSIHRPEICLPAQGWRLEGGHVKTVRLSNGHDLQVMRLLATRPITLNNGAEAVLENVFYYWFVGSHATTPYHLQRILMTNLDMVFHNINHRWAYVVVSAPVLKGLMPDGRDLEQTDEMLSRSVSELAPEIMKNP